MFAPSWSADQMRPPSCPALARTFVPSAETSNALGPTSLKTAGIAAAAPRVAATAIAEKTAGNAADATMATRYVRRRTARGYLANPGRATVSSRSTPRWASVREYTLSGGLRDDPFSESRPQCGEGALV